MITLTREEAQPVAWLDEEGFIWMGEDCSEEYKLECKPLFFAAPQRKWVGLTHEEKMEILTRSITAPSRIEVAEAALKEKNSG